MSLRIVKLLNKTLYDSIMALPDDIKYKIYREYFEPVIKEKQILYLSIRCNTAGNYKFQKLLIKIIKNTLNNEYICSYLCKTCESFNYTYNKYLKNRLEYTLITDEYEKFTVCFLHSLLH